MRFLAVALSLLLCLGSEAALGRSNPVNERLRQLCPGGHVFDVNKGCVPARRANPLRTSPSLASPPKFSPPGQTSRSGQRLDQIALLQFLLVWTGDYNGTIDGIPGPRTSRAWTDFLDRSRVRGTDEETWEALIAAAVTGLAEAGFRIERDHGLGLTYGLPAAIVAPRPSRDPTRRGFASLDGAVELEVARLSGYSLDSLYRQLANRRNRDITYEKMTADWFVLTGRDLDREFYVRYHRTGATIRGFSISYHPARASAIAPSVIAMSNLFRPDALAMDELVIFAESLATGADIVAEVSEQDWHDCETESGEAAFEACTRIIEIGDTPANTASAHFNRGIALNEAGRHADAVRDFTEVIRIAPDDAEAFHFRGLAHADAGDARRAIEDFSTAISLQPDYRDPHLQRAIVYLDAFNQYDPAIADFTRVLAAEPENALARYGRGIAYERKGDPGRALGDFRRVLWSGKPGDPLFEDAERRVARIESELSPPPAAQPPPAATPADPPRAGPGVASTCDERRFGDTGISVTLSCQSRDGRPVTMISVTGDIIAGDDRYFRQALLAAETPDVIVSLAGNGGDLDAGIAIGRAIWLSEAATVVEAAECASACALAWLAGRPRYMAGAAAIGFHAPWRDTGNQPEASTAGSAVVGAYLRDLGLLSAAIGYINEAGPTELSYLSFEKADALNIAVRRWEAGVAPAAAAAPPAAVPTPGTAFRDCPSCPELVVLPAGSFLMGSPDGEAGRQADEGPRRTVRFAEAFAIGRSEVTFDEWDACVADGGCDGHRPADAGWGRGKRPVINVSWIQAQAYMAWLSRKTGQGYRLPTEAEWEYAARGGTTTPYGYGTNINRAQANVAGDRTLPAASLSANDFSLYDVHGNVWEWVEDCYYGSYRGVPVDGTAVSAPACDLRVVRGGAWNTRAMENVRSAFRFRRVATSSRDSVGFRVMRSVNQDARASLGSP